MRAIVGAIITAASLLGLGLTAMGLGARYANHYQYEVKNDAGAGPNTNVVSWEGSSVRIRDLDNAQKVILTVLGLTTLIGLGTTFIGLAYHHERRLWEHQHRLHGRQGGPAPSAPATSHNVTS
jgi:hypothetical protein